MAYHVERNGVPLSNRASETEPYVLQNSVTLERAIGERPVGGLAVRVPAAATFAPLDFDEITIDYPGRPYRAEAERHADLVAYWRLDEAAVTLAADSRGGLPLTYGGAGDLQYRAYRSEGCPVPYGAAPEWTHSTAHLPGLASAVDVGTIGPEWTLAGFLRFTRPPGADTANREVWEFPGQSNPQLNLFNDGSFIASGIGSQPMVTGSVITPGVWHHVAFVSTQTHQFLYVDGVQVGIEFFSQPRSNLDGKQINFAEATGGGTTPVNLALDEWGLWRSAIDVPALYARRRHERLFGGYVFGVRDTTLLGPADEHVLELPLTGYGLRLDTSFVREVYASQTGSSVRAIVHDVLTRAGLSDVFSSHGVELDDIVTRAVFPVESVMTILRALAETHGAIVTVDEWREIDMVRRNNVQHSALVLSAANCRSIGRMTEPRFFADRAIVVGRGEAATVEDERAGNGVTTRFDASLPIGTVLSITEDGVEQTFEGGGARWTTDTDQQRFVLAPGETPPATVTIKFTYVASPALVVTVDSTTSTAPFRIARRIRDDTIDTPGVARVVAQSEVDRSDQRFEEFEVATRPGHIRSIPPGVAPSFTFPRHSLASTRLLVESVATASETGQNEGEHAVVHTIRATALDYHSEVGDDLRRPGLYQPPAPRPTTPTAADPDQTIIRPDNVAAPAQLPIQLGGFAGVLVSSTSFVEPDGAIRVRVSGHQIAVPLALSFMGRCSSRSALAPGQALEVQLYDMTTGQAIGSNIVVDDLTLDRYVLRAIALPLREFDLTWRARVTGSLRGGIAYGLALNLDVG